MYYYNLPIRLFALISLSIVLSYFYWKHLNRSEENSILKHKKTIYIVQLTFWLVFLSGIFPIVLPVGILSDFIFELLLLGIIFMALSFLLWQYFKRKKFDWLMFLSTLPLGGLFILALGMN